LNGHDDTLAIKVVEKTTIFSFLFDKNVKDNAPEVVVSIFSA
jgi:hypothetical protein